MIEKKLSKYASIFQDITARDVMTTSLITLTPDKKISYAKELMKIKKISGIPIINSKQELLGIISIEDIIKTMEYGNLNDSLESLMTKRVFTLRPEDKLPEIVDKLDSYKVGRLPVTNGDNKLVGIITKEDILHGILERFNLIYIHDTTRNSRLSKDYSSITGEVLSTSEAEFHYSIESTDIDSAGAGAALLQQFLRHKKIDNEIIRKVGIVTYEAETNVVIHSKSKGDIYCFLRDDRIIIQIIDYGIGIEDLDMAMTEGFSTADEFIREHGFGAGMGLSNMKKFTDKLIILTEKKSGTQVEVIFYLNRLSSEDKKGLN